MKTCKDICPWTLSGPRSEKFSESEVEENCELRGTDNVEGQISVRSFEAKLMKATVFIILQIFLHKAAFWETFSQNFKT